MPEFLERRYNSQSRSFLSIISLVSYILTKVAVTVYAGGVVFKDVFGIESIRIGAWDIDFFWVSAVGLVLITGLYTTFGGMKAVFVYLSSANTDPFIWICCYFGDRADKAGWLVRDDADMPGGTC